MKKRGRGLRDPSGRRLSSVTGPRSTTTARYNKVTGSSGPLGLVFPPERPRYFSPARYFCRLSLFAADSLQFRGLYRNSARPRRRGGRPPIYPGEGTLVTPYVSTVATSSCSTSLYGSHRLSVARRSLSTRRSGVYARRQSFLPPPPPPKPGGFMLTR